MRRIVAVCLLAVAVSVIPASTAVAGTIIDLTTNPGGLGAQFLSNPFITVGGVRMSHNPVPGHGTTASAVGIGVDNPIGADPGPSTELDGQALSERWAFQLNKTVVLDAIYFSGTQAGDRAQVTFGATLFAGFVGADG